MEEAWWRHGGGMAQAWPNLIGGIAQFDRRHEPLTTCLHTNDGGAARYGVGVGHQWCGLSLHRMSCGRVQKTKILTDAGIMRAPPARRAPAAARRHRPVRAHAPGRGRQPARPRRPRPAGHRSGARRSSASTGLVAPTIRSVALGRRCRSYRRERTPKVEAVMAATCPSGQVTWDR